MDPLKKQKWDEAYQDADIASASPAQVLMQNNFLLPVNGDALDLACGRAGNAQYLAKRGFQVDAIDSSRVVLDHLEQCVKKQDLSILCQQRDVETEGLSDKKYDVIVVSYFLYRDLFPQIIKALKPNGLLYYQAWAQAVQGLEVSGPKSASFRFQDGELLRLCLPLQILVYRENLTQGNIHEGLRSEAMIVAKAE